MPLVLLLFIVVPLVEIYCLVLVGRQIGALPTIALVMATAVIGVALLKRQGYSALARAREKMAKGEVPASEMVDGIFLAVGGALLLTPGFVTDGFGFACLVPGVRHALLGRVIARMKSAAFVQVRAGREFHRAQGDDGRTIEGQYRRED